MSYQQKKTFKQLIEPLNIVKFNEQQEKIKIEVHKSDQKLGDITLKKWVATCNKEVEYEITNKMQTKFLVLEDFNDRALKFIEALFHTWSIQDEANLYTPGKKICKIKYIPADDFYNKMLTYGFSIDIDRLEEITNIAFKSKPVE